MGDSAAQLRNTPIASLLDVHARGGGGGLTQPWAGVCVCGKTLAAHPSTLITGNEWLKS